jgi:hypothetical protein
MRLSVELDVFYAALWVDASESTLVTHLIDVIARTEDSDGEALERRI